MTVKEHYDNHLGNFYSWMAGDFDAKQKEFEFWLKAHNIFPELNGYAIDLGAGHGIQCIYGEIFMNLERNSTRTFEISKLLYDTYKSQITFNKDTIHVSFSKNNIINVDKVNYKKGLILPLEWSMN